MQSRQILLALDSSAMGGIETHILVLSRELIEKGHSVTVCFFDQYPGHPLYQKLDDHRIAYVFACEVGGFWQILKSMPRGSVLHTHGYKAGIVGRLMATALRLKVVSTFHSGDLGRGKLRIYSMLDLYTARLGKAIAVSKEIKERLGRQANLIPNFVALPKTFSAKALNPQRRNVAFVGRLSHEKGPDLYCALAQQSKDLPFTFNLYGDGPMFAELEPVFKQTVNFKGAVDMEKHWQDVDALCISSRAEGLPLVALEAMSRGIPIVTFDVGGLSQLIDSPDLGWVVPAGDIKGLKTALKHWFELDENKRETLRSAVHERIAKDYSAAALVGRIEALYG